MEKVSVNATSLYKKKNEHALQVMCVRWFRIAHKGHLLFAIPNGGARSAVTGSMLKSEGALAGVADLFLAAPSMAADGRMYLGFFIEMKTTTGVLRQNQREFAESVTRSGYKYAVCRSFEQFADEVDGYLATSGQCSCFLTEPPIYSEKKRKKYSRKPKTGGTFL